MWTMETRVSEQLTKRQRFAMAAMQGILASGGSYQFWKHLAEDAYAVADAMLEAGKETDDADD